MRAAGREEMRGGEGGSSPSILAEGERENEGRPVKEAEERRDSGYSGAGLPYMSFGIREQHTTGNM